MENKSRKGLNSSHKLIAHFNSQPGQPLMAIRFMDSLSKNNPKMSPSHTQECFQAYREKARFPNLSSPS